MVVIKTSEIPNYGDTKNCLKFIKFENGAVHVSWEIGTNEILVFEYNPLDYPQCVYYIYDNKDEYLSSQ